MVVSRWWLVVGKKGDGCCCMILSILFIFEDIILKNGAARGLSPWNLLSDTK
jgi:hypothetical protein